MFWIGAWRGEERERVAIESGLGLGGVVGEEVEEEVLGFLALATSGFKKASQDGVIFQSFRGASGLDDLAHDDDGSEAALGLVIGGRNIGTAEAGEEVVLFRTEEALAKSLWFGMAERVVA